MNHVKAYLFQTTVALKLVTVGPLVKEKINIYYTNNKKKNK